MVTAPAVAEQRFLLRNVQWHDYLSIAGALDERHVRATFDRGRLELMTLSYEHERCAALLGQFVEALTDELDMARQSGGSTTFRRQDVDRGLEPDRCYYLEHAADVHDKQEIDLTVDPPPDLAVEIDISHSSLDRMGVYGALGVPETWRYDGERLRVYQLAPGGSYAEAKQSRHFPQLPLDEVSRMLDRRNEMGETRLVRTFRLWVREQVARGWPT